ncbi:transcriptional regulator [Bacillus phage Izhevsk]|uniref:Putative lambda O-type replication initiator n=1 Tax=Bacillus phage Izhevsk TaxID=2724322 RepID=A0A6H0X6J5_9CAUD|nr:transcriptional regulator [Bacillus phage Izhevsk]QIW89916.1 putative lambda O-type replication initiator [Bacillus phage Izhevsk]
MYMIENFNNIQKLYSKPSVQIPNWIFRRLAESTKGKVQRTNVKQSSFAYAYVVTIAFLYKYTHFVDLDNGTYIQNKDIKQILGYDPSTKTIDKVIKKNGILDEIGLTCTTKNYPVTFEYTTEEINGFPIREFTTINMLTVDDVNYSKYKEIVKNRNYTVKEPTFFFNNDGDVGTLYNYNNTHTITLEEFMEFAYNDDLNNVDFFLYGFFKSKCLGLNNDERGISQALIISEIGLSTETFHNHIKVLEKKDYLSVERKRWRYDVGEILEPNIYVFKGVH